MTAQQKSALRLGLVTTVLGGLTVLGLSRLSEQVVYRAEFKVHEAKLESKIDRVLDVVCADKPELRQCQ